MDFWENNKKVLLRNRLNKKIEQSFQNPLSIISAPSGYGKTYAARLFFLESKADFIWISTYSYSDALSFWSNLYRQMHTLNIGIKDYSAALNIIPDKRIINDTLDKLLNTEFKNKTYLVIDDFHNITDMDIVNFLKQVIKYRINNLHILIITRKLPVSFVSDIPTLYDEIKMDDLKINKLEIKQYANLLDVELTPAQIGHVHRISNGWFSAAYILISGIKKGLDIAHSSHKVESLIKMAIYDELSNEAQQVLTELSFLDSFTLDQAEYVLDNKNVHVIIDELCTNTDILQYDSSVKAYVIHEVLRTFLQKECKKINVNLNLYYKRAGEWSLSKEMLPDALKYYHLSGDIYELLEKYEEIVHINKYFILPDSAYNILSQFGKQDYLKYPRAFIELGLIQMMQLDNKKMQLQGGMTLYAMQQMAKKSEDAFGDLNSYILGETYLLGSLAYYNDIEKMYETTKQAKLYFNGEKSVMITNYVYMPFNYINILYSFYTKQGELKKCRNAVRKWILTLADVTDGRSAGGEYIITAEYYLETGDFEQAEVNAQKAMYKGSMYKQLIIEMMAAFILMRIYAISGRQNELFECLESLQAKVAAKEDTFYKIPYEQAVSYIYTMIGKEKDIASWITDDLVFFEDICSDSAGYPSLIRSKAFICRKQYNLLDAHLDFSKKQYSKKNNQLGFIYNSIHLSIAQVNLNQKEKAKKTMMKSLDMCEQDGIIMPFVEYAEHILPILVDINNQSPNSFLQKIIRISRRFIRNKRVFKENIPLSARERQVIVLVAKGYDREEIAKELKISLNTVKKHLAKTYEKLKSKNKIEALNKAYELNII